MDDDSFRREISAILSLVIGEMPISALGLDARQAGFGRGLPGLRDFHDRANAALVSVFGRSLYFFSVL
jgi:hypothetical protein